MNILTLAQETKRLAEKATEVVRWYPHQYDGTIRGPFCRWFKCSEVDEKYRENVASVADDVEYGAEAMNAAPQLADAVIEMVEKLRRWAEYEEKTYCTFSTRDLLTKLGVTTED